MRNINFKKNILVYAFGLFGYKSLLGSSSIEKDTTYSAYVSFDKKPLRKNKSNLNPSFVAGNGNNCEILTSDCNYFLGNLRFSRNFHYNCYLDSIVSLYTGAYKDASISHEIDNNAKAIHFKIKESVPGVIGSNAVKNLLHLIKTRIKSEIQGDINVKRDGANFYITLSCGVGNNPTSFDQNFMQINAVKNDLFDIGSQRYPIKELLASQSSTKNNNTDLQKLYNEISILEKETDKIIDEIEFEEFDILDPAKTKQEIVDDNRDESYGYFDIAINSVKLAKIECKNFYKSMW